MRSLKVGLATVATVLSLLHHVQAGNLNVAVASNFTNAAKELAGAFRQSYGHQAILSFGATGQLYTQIVQGAPFEVLLAADDVRPSQAVTDGLGVSGSVFTYAIGRLALYSTVQDVTQGDQVLSVGAFDHIAIANPETAPYGKASEQTMRALGVFEALQPKIVQGQNIGQTFQFVASGNAELGFVSLGQISQATTGTSWIVPQELYEPIRQDAVLLNSGADNPAALAFLGFLGTPEALSIIEKYGYAVDR
jgi:molybdate transport system substrate-binding protein